MPLLNGETGKDPSAAPPACASRGTGRVATPGAGGLYHRTATPFIPRRLARIMHEPPAAIADLAGPSRRTVGSVRRNAVGAASGRDRVARGRVICSTKAQSRVVDSIVVSPCLVAGRLTKSGSPALHRGERSGSGCALFRRLRCLQFRPVLRSGSRESSGVPSTNFPKRRPLGGNRYCPPR